MERILTKINLLWASTVTLLSSAFGAFWWAFGLFAIRNNPNGRLYYLSKAIANFTRTLA